MYENRMISFEVKALSNLIMRALSQRLPHDEEPLTGVQRWVIGYLSEHPDRDVFQRDLEAEFHIRRSTASGILRLLEQHGLVRREPVGYDARLKKLVLTERSRALLEEMCQTGSSVDEQLMRGFTAGEIQMLYDFLDRMFKNLE